MSDPGIPRYIEGSDPGFHELTPEVLETLEETAEQRGLRIKMLREIVKEFERLNLDEATQEFFSAQSWFGQRSRHSLPAGFTAIPGLVAEAY